MFRHYHCDGSPSIHPSSCDRARDPRHFTEPLSAQCPPSIRTFPGYGFNGRYCTYPRFSTPHSSGRSVDAPSRGERPERPTYMLIALNRRNRDQHNETDNQRTLHGLSSRFHIIMLASGATAAGTVAQASLCNALRAAALGRVH